ncbi:MAG: hypothetical protein WAT39_22645 [Planctomycetota bacterium]
MNPDRDTLIEAAITAHRQPAPDGELAFHPAFHDLDAAGREALFAELWRQRALERALARDGLSSTARLVLRRVRAGP